MSNYRREKDTLGEVRVPAVALWGAQTQRAVENYPISGLREHPIFIRAFIDLKKAAALANKELGGLEPQLADAIIAACDELLKNEMRYRNQFVVDVFQAGAGTSLNMNCNEVIANRGRACADVIKSGRTQLQDAVPVTLGQEFKAYAAAVRRGTKLLHDSAD